MCLMFLEVNSEMVFNKVVLPEEVHQISI